METNRYAPPQAVVADLTKVPLKRRSVLLMILFSLVTLGLYYPVWFLRRRTALNQLDSPRKLQQWPFIVVIAWFVFQFFLGVAVGVARGTGSGELIGENAQMVLTGVRLLMGILLVIQCFFVKDILEDDFAGPDDQPAAPLSAAPVTLSGVLTFIFGIFYLQYAINRHLAESTPA